MLPPLPDDAVTLRADAADWRAAVRLVGDALVRSGAATAEYGEAMIRVVEEFGAYVVIAPGLALAHARPGPETLADGLAVVTLTEPVAFGHAHNDPVDVIVGLAVTTVDRHVSSVADMANIFNDATAIPRLRAATTVDEVRRIMAGEESA
ncbi:PTS sugar transporter subunit IIA [Clavibacter michiganensis]|uniref:PTS sugar transporter subunit IIA n=1 Tax=Clavibacter michiganensis TaxID=28447 RepID=UPI000A3A0029|nr:PTS sugar transporter subunit IIA [Clavibacter michiganensis]KAF0260059.1 Ascorbate-specific phosphotransferase enzyme IIA component [Clavibacter michiganensis subsp. michiganensis]MDO4031940.1 PTS sugar transporter subunit IIA [Clavibacter michiganensis]MDO4081973.1 PTS sugar transporter subunit IIA [Clavibacter michiganensis]MDO4086663.1 PTS sugar transporter subunit IIA [Clavibacter michiganensis]MDO4096750.1 PTS sugar transporter subunit IIA [Clavibacter michiganensis]